MTKAIVEYKPFYVVQHKDGRTWELPEELGKRVQQERVTKNKQCVLMLGDDAIDGFDIKDICKHKPSNDIDEYIMRQPKNIRDKLKKIGITFNSITHVSNYIEAINEGKF